MYRNNIKIIITTLLFLLFLPGVIFAGNQNNRLSKALMLFDAGNYAEAEPILKILLDENPNHLIINYYYGACRTENKHYGINEIVCLLNGSVGESPLLTDYYLGIQYHAKNSWEEALNYYNSFTTKTKKTTQEEYDLSEKIQMCRNKINPFVTNSSDDVMPVAIKKEEQEESTPIIGENQELNNSATYAHAEDTEETEAADTTVVTTTETAKEEKITVNADPIDFTVNSEITYPDTSFFKTSKGLKLYLQHAAKQKELERNTAHVEELRKKYGDASSYSEKKSLGELILNGETEIYKLQDETAGLLLKARNAENMYWEKATEAEKEDTKKLIKTYRKKIDKQKVKNEKTTVTPPAILYEDTHPATGKNDTQQDELIYKIQLGAYSHGIPSYRKSLFKKLSYIRKIDTYTDEKGVVIYTIGNLNNYKDALKMQEQVKQEGVKDASIVAYFNNKRISLEEAKEIEAEK